MIVPDGGGRRWSEQGERTGEGGEDSRHAEQEADSNADRVPDCLSQQAGAIGVQCQPLLDQVIARREHHSTRESIGQPQPHVYHQTRGQDRGSPPVRARRQQSLPVTLPSSRRGRAPRPVERAATHP